MPFENIGAGALPTDIRGGDLSATFQFSVQREAGLHLFLCDNLALTIEYRFVHLSNGGIAVPNQGVDTSTALAGLTGFF